MRGTMGRWWSYGRFLFGLLCAVNVVRAQDAASPGTTRQSYEQLRAASRLDGEGRAPFHLVIAAQINDLAGKPSETGTVEEWWVSPRKYRIEISGPWGKGVETSDGEVLGGTALRRSNFLLDELRKEIVNPLAPLSQAASIGAADRNISGSTFHCLAVDRSGKNATPVTPPVYCATLEKPSLRISFPSVAETVVRNRLATFHTATVAMTTAIDLDGRVAISGQITTLQGFDPSTSTLPELREPERISEETSGEEQEPLPETVASGRLLAPIAAVYPEPAKAQHISGDVVIGVIIARDGTVRSQEVLASPSPLLTGASLQAVKKARYAPFLLSGKPVEVTTVIVINFRIG